MNEVLPQQPDLTSVVRARRRATLILTGIVGAAFGLYVMLMAQRSGGAPKFTQTDFNEAQKRWSVAGPASYDIEVDVSGRQPATYRVQVRSGQVSAAFRNDLPLKQRRTMGTWSVPGMFDTMSRDVSNRELVGSGKASRGTPQLSLRCQFHPEFGYPRIYQRLEHRKFGSNMEVTWRVTRFVVR